MDESELAQLREETIEHLNDLFSEVVRRDEWLINSIWNVAKSLNYAVFTGIGLGFVAFKDDAEWWETAFVVISCAALMYFQGRHMKRLEEDDKKRIGNESRLTSFASWWR